MFLIIIIIITIKEGDGYDGTETGEIWFWEGISASRYVIMFHQ